ncbi:MAG: hemerythrin domain-containing protein [Planctomycetes bacterium]|nr:hemerythrin domain-containing protein [Planctomycetota bacterium]
MPGLCQSLEAEHRVIERVLRASARAAGSIEKGGAPDAVLLGRAVQFMRGYTDGVHHQKEERVLFPAMEAAGVPRAGGPIGVMFTEHEMGRRHVAALESALRGPMGREAMRALAALLRDYVTLLENHIGKEDNVLYPMAERVLDEPVKQQVLAGFLRAEAAEDEAARKLRAWAESLA